ncbi:MAG: hypothetical protein WEA58_02120 [Balneolaceae bacterium]
MFTDKVIEATNEVAELFISKTAIFLTESDFKVAMSNKIREKFDKNITVNTESPWYDNYITNKTYFVDITAFDQNKLQITYDPTLNRKGYKYDDEALAVELKYFRFERDINEVSKDFDKTRLLIKSPKNECFIIASARTIEIFDKANDFMQSQLNLYEEEFKGRIKVFLIGPEQIIDLN